MAEHYSAQVRDLVVQTIAPVPQAQGNVGGSAWWSKHRNTLPRIVVFVLEDERTKSSMGPSGVTIDVSLVLILEMWAEGDNADLDMEAMRLGAENALLADTTLGGVVKDVEVLGSEPPQYDPEAAKLVAMRQVRVMVKLRVLETDSGTIVQ